VRVRIYKAARRAGADLAAVRADEGVPPVGGRRRARRRGGKAGVIPAGSAATTLVAEVTRSPERETPRSDPARAGHRPQRLRRLPRLRDELQAVEHLGRGRPAGRQNPYGADPTGTFFNRVQTFEVGEFPDTQTVHFPKSCLHCEDPPCVPVCPTGASYKRKEDGIVLVDYDKCIGCKYCSWACPYGVRELDEQQKVMKKCTLCVDRIYDEQAARGRAQAGLRDGLPDQRAAVRRRPRPRRPRSRVAIRERGGYPLMPEWGTHPANHYLPRRSGEWRVARGFRRAALLRCRCPTPYGTVH
jgi:Fe-S-cluster-containing dehydrogenase component